MIKTPTLTSRGRRASLLLAAAALAIGAGSFASRPSSAKDVHLIPPPASDERADGKASEVAVVAGGCFWGVQGVFQHVEGVTAAVSGYAGGERSTAHYEEVSTGETGHAEAVRVTFDPRKISYGRILQIYFSVAHNPTEMNHQGPDDGTQYRSAIFPTSSGQAEVARAYKAQLDGAHVFGAPVVTSIEPNRAFYPAEAHHQDFLARNPTYPYIAVNDMPKVAALKQLFPDQYRTDPVLVASAPLTE